MEVGTVSIRAVAVFEAVKGLLVVIAGFGMLSLLHRDAQQVAEQLVRHLHLDAARRYPRIFIEAASHLDNAHLWWLAALAGGYATIRLAEAWGLWFQRSWAEWLAAISGVVYIPFELYGIAVHGVTTLRMMTFTGNVLVVVVMVYALRARRRVPVPSA